MLPSYQRSPLAPAAPSDPFLSSGPEPPLRSHLVLPTPLPKVNYKHLYLVRRILSRRMTDTRPADLEAASRRTPSLWEPDVQILTSGSSTALGGLPGHAESIYSLHLFRRAMRIPMSTNGPEELVSGLSAAWPSPARMSTSWPGPGSPATTTVVSGRDWLLSGSRDCTLRLWALGTRPRVVKIFSGGHTRSILTHFVTEVPVADEPEAAGGPGGRGSPGAHGHASNGGSRRTKLMAISAGSDGRIVSWDLEGDGSPDRVVQAHTDSIFFMRGNHRHLVSCSKDRSIKLFRLSDLSCILTIPPEAEGAHRGAINAVSLTDELIVSASGDKSIKAWDIRTGRMVASCEAHSRGISSIGFEPAPRARASGASSGGSGTSLGAGSASLGSGLSTSGSRGSASSGMESVQREAGHGGHGGLGGTGTSGFGMGGVGGASVGGLGGGLGGAGGSLASGWKQTIKGSTLLGTLVTGSSDSTIKTFFLVEVPPSYEEEVSFEDMMADGAVGAGGTGFASFGGSASALGSGGGAGGGGWAGHAGSNASGGPFGGHAGAGGVGSGDMPMASSEEGPEGADDTGLPTSEPFVPPNSTDGRRVIFQPGPEYWARCACALPMTPPNAHGCLRCNNRGHTDLVRSLHVSEDVTLSASYDSTTKIWDRHTGRLIFDFEGCHSGRVFAITGDRMRVVSSGLDARIAIIDFGQGLDTAFV